MGAAAGAKKVAKAKSKELVGESDDNMEGVEGSPLGGEKDAVVAIGAFEKKKKNFPSIVLKRTL